jgi:ferrous iron transport protein B
MARRGTSGEKRIVVAIGGNPNSGKTTIFNALTGSRQKVGNWGGVTVEKKEGIVEYGGYTITFVDLPGTYSMTAYSLEEIIARNFIVNNKPDVVIDIIDAGNLERNLYLAVQLIEMGGRFIFVLNMADMAEKQGLVIDREKLATLLGGPVVFTVGNRGRGIRQLLDEVIQVYEGKESKTRHLHVAYGNELEEELQKVQKKIWKDRDLSYHFSTRWLSMKLLEADQDVKEKLKERSQHFNAISKQVEMSRKHLKMVFSDEPENLIVDQRYGFISGLLQECIAMKQLERVDTSQKIDKVLTNRLIGIPILVFFIWLMFQVTYKVGAYPMGWIESAIDFFNQGISQVLPDSLFKSLLIDGIIGGVGGVAVFLPNILLLFFMISIFEDTGYMARAAFVMDRVMHLIGLHGKSFISMIMGFGCNVPAIMATRTLENRKDRLLTILINPLMSCSARLPVYVLVAGAFFGANAGNVIFSMYALGAVLAILIGRLFRKTIFRGESEPFVMELPPYRIPTLKSVVIHMWERAFIFLKKMGTVILVGSIIIWFLSTFPLKKEYSVDYDLAAERVGERFDEEIRKFEKSSVNDADMRARLGEEKLEALGEIERKKSREEVSQSFIGIIGHAIEPFFRPLGFSWREGVALITGFVAKEVVVSTLGVLYNAGREQEGELSLILRDRSGLTPVTAYAFLVFVLIYTPCLATLAAIRQETGTMKWTLFSVFYEITLAWVLAFVIVRVGRLFTMLF